MTYRDRDFDRGQGSMDWGGQGNDYRGRFSRQDQFGSRGNFGGWNDEEQEFSGEPGFRGQERFGESFGGEYGRGGYGRRYGRPPVDWQDESYDYPPFSQGGGWQQGPAGGRGYRGAEQFGDRGYGSSMGPYGGQGYGPREFAGAGGGLPNAEQSWGTQGRTRGGSWDQDWGWERGASGRGHWGQGYSDEDFGAQGQPRQRVSGQGYGQGPSTAPVGTFYYEEVWLTPGPYSGRGPRGYQRSDQRIEEDICERLTQHGQVDAEDIEVRVKNGEVTLTGTVENRRAKRMAEALLDSVSGVKDVHNQLRVQRFQEQGRTDQDQLIGQAQMGQGGSSRSQSQDRTQSRRAETAAAGASSS